MKKEKDIKTLEYITYVKLMGETLGMKMQSSLVNCKHVFNVSRELNTAF